MRLHPAPNTRADDHAPRATGHSSYEPALDKHIVDLGRRSLVSSTDLVNMLLDHGLLARSYDLTHHER